MNMKVSRFELLPNEILTDIAGYLDAREAYHALYGLNMRFKGLLQSLDRLHIRIHYKGRNRIRHDHLFASRVHTLIVDRNRLLDNLHQFPNIRQVVFIKSTAKKVEHVINQLDNLEHLIVKVKSQNVHRSPVCQRIFTNDFPRLKSFVFKATYPVSSMDTWTEAPSIQFLDVMTNVPRIHMFLLAACPNLHLLKLTTPNLAVSFANVQLHTKLQRLYMTITTDQRSFDELAFDSFFVCLPNLEYLHLRQTVASVDMIHDLERSQWLASALTSHLLSLRRFKLTLCVSADQHLDTRQLKTSFSRAHDHWYEHELIIR